MHDIKAGSWPYNNCATSGTRKASTPLPNDCSGHDTSYDDRTKHEANLQATGEPNKGKRGHHRLRRKAFTEEEGGEKLRGHSKSRYEGYIERHGLNAAEPD